jgi:serine/threonine protein kinase
VCDLNERQTVGASIITIKDLKSDYHSRPDPTPMFDKDASPLVLLTTAVVTFPALSDIPYSASVLVMVEGWNEEIHDPAYKTTLPVIGSDKYVIAKPLILAMPDERRRHMIRRIERSACLQHETLMSPFRFIPGDAGGQFRHAAVISESMNTGLLQSIVCLNDPQFDEASKFIVIYGVCVGMLILHSRDIVNFNLKPSTILFDECFEPKLCDFGISEFTDRCYFLKRASQRRTLGLELLS